MAGYRYSPQWDQHANRDSDIVDPVLVVRPLSRWEFTTRQPVNQVDSALVFTSARGGYAVYVPPHRPSRGELSSGRFVSVHEVDLGIHHFQRLFPLPSNNDAFSFRAELDVSWRVVAADLVVASQVRDVPAHVTPRLEERLRVVSRGYAIEDSARAEAAVRNDLAGTQLAQDLGLHLTFRVRLDLDDAARAQQTALRDIGYERDRAVPQFELERLQQAHRHQLEQAQLAHEQQMLAEKAKYYAWYLEQGGVVSFALQLAEHPEDLPRARELLSREQQALVTRNLEMLDRVAASGHFENHQLAEPLRQTLRAIHRLFAETRAPAAPAAELPSGDGADGAGS
ncbi:PE-PGRS family protein [Streptomyces sp. NPDC127098]|uniref:PE-PGRS family protein n=1 Tax=Streptomyces sp. NPDC127098 TaxID=3347137 RepID=UPI00364F2D2F